MDKIVVGGIGGMGSIWDIYDGLMGCGRSKVVSGSSPWIPRADVVTRVDGVVVTMDVPGYSSKDIEVKVEDGKLVIEGSRVRDEALGGAEGKNGSVASVTSVAEVCTLRERGGGESFSRSFTMAEDTFEIEKIEAKVRDGILEVKVPMKPVAPVKASRGISIKVG
jgi:HSP20 family molecular chaperone IbpA